MQSELLEYKVLFIEDDKEINQRVTSRLKRYFKTVYSVTNAEDGYQVYLDLKPDIMFIDINLPKMNGVELLEKIRVKDHNTKAVMLTARSDIDIVLKATELKLTKYLIKPLNRKELEDTIEILIYEINNFKTVNEKNIYFQNNFFWNKEKLELYENGTKISLTATEDKIFQCFINNLNRVLSYDDIIIDVWDDMSNDKKETLKTTLKNLRKKIPDDLIQNVYGIGYKLVY